MGNFGKIGLTSIGPYTGSGAISEDIDGLDGRAISDFMIAFDVAPVAAETPVIQVLRQSDDFVVQEQKPSVGGIDTTLDGATTFRWSLRDDQSEMPVAKGEYVRVTYPNSDARTYQMTLFAN